MLGQSHARNKPMSRNLLPLQLQCRLFPQKNLTIGERHTPRLFTRARARGGQRIRERERGAKIGAGSTSSQTSACVRAIASAPALGVRATGTGKIRARGRGLRPGLQRHTPRLFTARVREAAKRIRERERGAKIGAGSTSSQT